MTTWIFQGNPDRYKIDEYLQKTKNIYWSVKFPKHQNEVAIGDIVYIWRAQGSQKTISGIIAIGTVTQECKTIDEIPDDPNLGDDLWIDPDDHGSGVHAGIHITEIRLNPESGMLNSSEMQEDPILSKLQILTSRVGTNFIVPEFQAQKLKEFWDTKKQLPPMEPTNPPVKDLVLSPDNLHQGMELSNEELCDIFKCSPQGGMRKSNTHSALILISNHIDSIYDDRWIYDIFHYTGMGLEGDQSLDFLQNKTLSQSTSNGIRLYLFEVFKERKYTYIGEVGLYGEPYKEIQPDQNGNDRSVWMFPLRLVVNKPYILPKSTIDSIQTKKQKKATRLSDIELKIRATKSAKIPGNRLVTTTQIERSIWVSEYTKRRAKGVCELCQNQAPFKNSKGEPYLETHHIIWLSNAGEDTIENTVALCPNCHRKMHILNQEKDLYSLKDIKK